MLYLCLMLDWIYFTLYSVFWVWFLEKSRASLSPDFSQEYCKNLFSFTFELIEILFLYRFQISLLQTCLQSQMISQTFWIWMKINKTFHAQMAHTPQGKELNEEKQKNVFMMQCIFATFNLYFSFLKLILPSFGLFLISAVSLSCIKTDYYPLRVRC